jgi:hypothetical protein
MDVWTITTILIGAVALALLLAYILRSRSTDHDVWEELPKTDEEDPKASTATALAENPFARAEDVSRPGVHLMSSLNSASPTPRDAELRRSSRVEQPVQLIVLGTNRHGEPFQERTAAVSFNLHGCRYASRHEAPRESWVTLQVTGTDGATAPPVRARVCSIQSPQSPREMCQIGVELETPANIWGVTQPPEDWQRVLGSSTPSARAATAAAPALDPSAPPASFMQRPANAPERRAEVTMFPSPAGPESAATKESAAAKSERVTFTADQLLQALQGKLQIAAERAVETALAERLDQTVQQTLAKMDEGWKANARQTEEFSAARLAEVQSRWERELVVYRSRAEEISRRVETLGTSGRQALTELQKFADRIQNEIQPQFTAHVEQSLARASSDLESKAGEHTASIAEAIQASTAESRAQLEEILGEARALLSAAKEPSAAGVSEERLASLLNCSREAVLNRTEERLSDVWMQFEQQQDQTSRRCDELSQHLEMLSTQLNEAKALNERALEEMRSTLTGISANLSSSERLESAIKIAKEQIFNHLEWRLGEVSGRSDQQHNTVQQRADELFRRVDGLAADSANARSQAEQSAAELRGLLANASAGVSPQHLDGALNSVREQLMNHLEWRLGEVSGQFEQQHDAMRQRFDELSQRFDALMAELRARLEEGQAKTESLVHDLRPQDLVAIEQSVDRASKDFEASAARISDRQLVRLMQQKQALSAEASLELEARASETRALLQKAANSMLDDFGRRFESHIDLVIAEANERVASSLASLDAESRAACEVRRRDMELQIARAAEQSTAEFRSGIKAFLYSCLVAAVSGVDEHAQSTLASLAKDAAPATLNAIAESGSSAASNGTPRSGEPHT